MRDNIGRSTATCYRASTQIEVWRDQITVGSPENGRGNEKSIQAGSPQVLYSSAPPLPQKLSICEILGICRHDNNPGEWNINRVLRNRFAVWVPFTWVPNEGKSFAVLVLLLPYTTTAQKARSLFPEFYANTASDRSRNMINLVECSVEPLRFGHPCSPPPLLDSLKSLWYCDPWI